MFCFLSLSEFPECLLSSIFAQTLSFNNQVKTHWDKNNALLFDSACFFGNHWGGELILSSLGATYYGLHGYSLHGLLHILFHGVGNFDFPKGLKYSLQQYLISLWSWGISFASVAKFSAHSEENNVSSLSKTKTEKCKLLNMWPILMTGF